MNAIEMQAAMLAEKHGLTLRAKPFGNASKQWRGTVQGNAVEVSYYNTSGHPWLSVEVAHGKAFHMKWPNRAPLGEHGLVTAANTDTQPHDWRFSILAPMTRWSATSGRTGENTAETLDPIMMAIEVYFPLLAAYTVQEKFKRRFRQHFNEMKREGYAAGF